MVVTCKLWMKVIKALALLERSGGKVSVGAGDGEKGQPKGARVTVRWPRQAIETADPALEPRKA